MADDKQREFHRYEARAAAALCGGQGSADAGSALGAMPAYLRTPYLRYASLAAELIQPGHRVLELGSGTGAHTATLMRPGAQVVASDISPSSLALLQQRLTGEGRRLETQVADIEALPFPDSSFDVLACAGSLSYGEPGLVDAEIRRVLRPGGALLCVDSLNHNPIYRLNRLVHCLRGNRSRSTLVRMPGMARIAQLSAGFGTVETQFFGALSFAMPVLAGSVGAERAQSFSDWFDRAVGTRRAAFKFVLLARGLDKP